MKKAYLFLFLFMTLAAANFSRAENSEFAKPDCTITLSPWLLMVNPNNYMSAQYVVVKVLDANNNVLATTQTTPGQAVTFARNAQQRKVSCTYHSNGSNAIIIDIIDIG